MKLAFCSPMSSRITCKLHSHCARQACHVAGWSSAFPRLACDLRGGLNGSNPFGQATVPATQAEEHRAPAGIQRISSARRPPSSLLVCRGPLAQANLGSAPVPQLPAPHCPTPSRAFGRTRRRRFRDQCWRCRNPETQPCVQARDHDKRLAYVGFMSLMLISLLET